MESIRAGWRKPAEMGTGPTPPHLARGPKIYAIPAKAVIASLGLILGNQ
jgi:hypothetical protein